MTDEQIERLLDAGITFAKEGKSHVARGQLLKVVEIDPKNERAWLWLSGVVETNEEREICLRNVLALNPNNRPATRGLERLKQTAVQKASGPESPMMERHNRPISPAAAILYPKPRANERHEKDGQKQENVPRITLATQSSYDDIWERDDEICAFCAQAVDVEDNRCPSCRRSLTSSHFRYQSSSPDLTVYWVLLVGIGQLFFLRLLFGIIVGESVGTLWWQGLAFVVMIGLAVGIYLRRFWVYISSITVLLAVLVAGLLDFAAGMAAEEKTIDLFSEETLRDISSNLYAFGVGPLLEWSEPFQIVAVSLALLYGLWRVGPDFERVKVRHVASVDRGIREASHFYSAGAEFAEKEMWASAVLHWRRAAALDPNRAFYQFRLGEGYARLGFFQRALGVLESAKRLATDPALQSKIEQLEAWAVSKQVVQ